MRRLAAGLGAAALIVALAVAPAVPVFAAKAPWTTETSVGVTYLQRGDGPGWVVAMPGEVVFFSPDRRYFYFITHRGEIRCDCNVLELKVFDAEQVKKRDAAPLRTLTLKSRYHKGNESSGLDAARWLEDSRTIAFLGAEGDSPLQVHTLDVVTGETKVVSSAPLGVTAFSVSGSGSIIYRGIAERRVRNKLKTYPSTFVDVFDMGEVGGWAVEDVYKVFASYRGGPAVEVAPSSIDEMYEPFFVSPDGKHAIRMRGIQEAEEPASWRGYNVPHDSPDGKPLLPRTRIPFQYTLTDLETRKSRPVVDAPTGRLAFISAYEKALWSPDSKRVILLNTMLPLGERGRSTTGYILEYDLATQASTVIEPLVRSEKPVIVDAEWLDAGNSIVVSRISGVGTGPAPERTVHARQDGKWAKVGAAPASGSRDDGLRVEVKEDVNTPAVVVARYKGREIALTAPDPVVADAARAKVEVVTWKDKLGATWTGGITLPAVKPEQGKIPLIVQIYDFMPDRFLPDGITTTAYAMQPLAARGFAVLQMGMPRTIVNEGPPFVEAFDSGVEMAVERFGVDPEKVGLLGFSRSGGRTAYAITHPGRTKIAASIIADGGIANFGYYLGMSTTFPDIAKSAQGTFDAINGGPFWSAKQSWLERAPSFNLERVEAPVLITSAGGPFIFIAVNEMYMGLKMLNKPVDVIVFPEGAHQLMLPKERLASMNASVDWMSYWLQGVKDSDPAKSEQYRRWDELRGRRKLD